MRTYEVQVSQRVIEIASRDFASIDKALIELIANSDESYSNLDKTGIETSNTIQILLERHNKAGGTQIQVLDEAEGMDYDKIIEIMKFGGAQSSLAKEGQTGRGFFGMGLKQAFTALGRGYIESIKDGKYSKVEYFKDANSKYVYGIHNKEEDAQDSHYCEMRIAQGRNGTKITIVIEQDIKIPVFESLFCGLSNNYSLRETNARRIVTLCQVDGKKRLQEERLRFDEPEHNMLIGPDFRYAFTYNGEEYDFLLTLKQSKIAELKMKGDERTNGLLIKSGISTLDCQFFKFEGELGTEKLYGSVDCLALNVKQKQGEVIYRNDRNGLNTKNGFVIALADKINEILEPWVAEEKKRKNEQERGGKTSAKTKEQIKNILDEFNSIAKAELMLFTDTDKGQGKSGEKESQIEKLICFSMPIYYREVNHSFKIRLLLNLDQLNCNFNIETELVAGTESISLKNCDGISVFNGSELRKEKQDKIEFILVGHRIGEMGSMVARLRDSDSGQLLDSDECLIDIVAEKKPNHSDKPRDPKKKWDNTNEMFRGFELRAENNELVRCYYDKNDRKIIINTDAPTVKLYFDDKRVLPESSNILLAELLMDCIASSFAMKKLEQSVHHDLEEVAALKQDYIRLYGERIHKSLQN